MTREPRWVGPFLKGLERCGNVRLAAEGAGVDFTTAYQRRKRHEGFAEAWEGALRFHASRGAEAGQTPPPSAFADGFGGRSPSPPLCGREELEIRSDGLASGECFPSIRSGKLIKGSEARWGKRAETRFLTELTVSGSVRRAAVAAGFSTTAIYKQRAKSGHFAAAWDAALETGKARVQAYLVEAATRTFDPDELPVGDEREMAKVSISEAINIAKLKGGASTMVGGGGTDEEFDGRPITREDWEEARQNIVNRLARLRERNEAEEQATGRCLSCGQVLPGLGGAG